MVNRLDPEQVERNARGVAACRAVVDEALSRRTQPDEDTPVDRSEEIHQAAARQTEALRRLTRANTTNPLVRRKEHP